MFFGISRYIIMGLAAALAVACFIIWIMSNHVERLEKKNGQLTARIETLLANIELQNTSIEEWKKKSNEYEKKLLASYSSNKKMQAELQDRLKEIEQLKLPTECNAKIEFFKEKLIEFGKIKEEKKEEKKEEVPK